jgi:hypothetical protein
MRNRSAASSPSAYSGKGPAPSARSPLGPRAQASHHCPSITGSVARGPRTTPIIRQPRGSAASPLSRRGSARRWVPSPLVASVGRGRLHRTSLAEPPVINVAPARCLPEAPVPDPWRLVRSVAAGAYLHAPTSSTASGELGWRTPAERFDGTAFTDRDFNHSPCWRALPLS